MADQKISELTAITGANTADDDLLVIVDTSASQTKNITLGELENALAERDFSFGDNDKLTFGDSNDLQIYHDGSTSIIKDAGVGELQLHAENNLRLQNLTGSTYAKFTNGAQAELYYGGNLKLATTSTGVDVTGTVTSDGLTVDGTLASPSVLQLNNAGGTWTAGDEIGRIQFYSADGSGIGAHEAASIRAVTNQGGVQTDGTLEFWRSPYNSSVLKALEIDGPTGDISFYEDTGTTAKMVWDASADALTFGDSVKATFGAGSDLQIYHDGANSIIEDAGTGYLNIKTNGGYVIVSNDSAENLAYFQDGGEAALYWNGATGKGKKLATTSTGIDVTGTVTADGLTVDNTGGGSSVVTVSGNDQANVRITLDNNGAGGNEWEFVGGNHGANNADLTVYDKTNTAKRALFSNNGDISFYEDTGTTPKFFWDASAESLTLGTDSGDAFNAASLLRIQGTPDVYGSIKSATTGIAGWTMGDTDDDVTAGIFYNNASDYLYLLSNNAERMRIDSSGNVGIGTSSPTSPLHLYSSSNQLITVESADANANIAFKDNSTTNVAQVGVKTDDMFFATNGTERMRIDSSGNVGIGTTSPQYPLHTYGAVGISDDDDTARYRFIVDDDGTDARFRIRQEKANGLASASNDLTIVGGNVGIGTTSPSAVLHANGSSQGDVYFRGETGSTKGLLFSTFNVNATDHAGHNINAVSSVGEISFSTGSTERMRIDSVGNVGIGTTSPSGSKLHLNNAASSTYIRFQNTSASDIYVGADGTNLVAYNGGSERMRIDSSGNVGIGTPPASGVNLHLHEAGSGQMLMAFTNDTTGSGSNDGLHVGLDSSENAFVYNKQSTALYFGTSNTERMRIDSSGNVGIGTTSPSSLLHLNSAYPKITLNDTQGVNRAFSVGTNNETFTVRNETGSTDALVIDNNNNVGIGTSSPTYPLEVMVGASRVLRAGTSFVSIDATGSASAPSLIIDGDDNTGFWHPAADTLAVSTAGAERMRIDSSGNVGIGTTSPETNLHIENASSFSIIRLVGSTTETVGVDFGDPDDRDIGRVRYNNSDNSMVFHTNAAEHMRIDSSGNVGIGVVPSAWASNYSVLEGVNGQSISFTGNTPSFTSNGYFTGTAWTYKTSNYASNYYQYAGQHIWRTAPSGTAGNAISFSEAMRIDSSGNVGIGTSSPSFGDSAQGLEVKRSGGNVTVRVNYDGSAQGQFTATSSSIKLETRTSGIPLVFGTAAVERMRIDSSGNLLVGTTSNVVNSVSGGQEGFYYQSGDYLAIARDSGQPLYLNRLTNDGELLQFRKDGLAVGSIGSSAGNSIYMASGDVGVRFSDVNDAIYPMTSGGVNRDAATDLGISSVRFKDLYLSGGVYLGGTGAANKLDDYEEGTWTPVINQGASSVTYNVQAGRYNKVGSLVVLTFQLSFTAWTGTADNVEIGGFPFIVFNSNDNRGQGSLLIDNLTSSQNHPLLQANIGQSEGVLLSNVGGTGTHAGLAGNQLTASTIIRCTITYATSQ